MNQPNSYSDNQLNFDRGVYIPVINCLKHALDTTVELSIQQSEYVEAYQNAVDMIFAHNKCKIGIESNIVPKDFPRRNRLDLCTPAELAIVNAVNEVEKVGADTRLTEAVILLDKARNLVADFIDDNSNIKS